jgi:hypothetical protein
MAAIMLLRSLWLVSNNVGGPMTSSFRHFPSSRLNDRTARRNALVLAAAQAFYGMAAVNIIITAGLVGTQIAPSLSLATLPVSTFVIGTALSTIPASMFMRRVGRRPGFLTGAACLAWPVRWCAYGRCSPKNFWLFSFGTFLQGGYQAFAGYYRFAAADTASASVQAEGHFVGDDWRHCRSNAGADAGDGQPGLFRAGHVRRQLRCRCGLCRSLPWPFWRLSTFRTQARRHQQHLTRVRLGVILRQPKAAGGNSLRHDGLRHDEPGDDGHAHCHGGVRVYRR